MLVIDNVNENVLNETKRLEEKYRETYGKEVDYSILPAGMTQEKLPKILELMISDNLSLSVAYSKLYGDAGVLGKFDPELERGLIERNSSADKTDSFIKYATARIGGKDTSLKSLVPRLEY